MTDTTQQTDASISPDRFMLQRLPAHADPALAEQVPIHFTGPGSGVDALSWGQAGLWDAMRRQGSWFPIGAVTPLPAGTTVPDLAAELRFLISRHQPLRTRLRLAAAGTAQQVVSNSGQVLLDIFDAPDEAQAAAAANAVLRHYSQTDYDFCAEWPIRMAGLRHRGALRYRVIVLCHLAADGMGAATMMAELADRAAAGREPVTAMEPLAQARWQRSPQGQRCNQAGLSYCERVLRQVPARRFPPPSDRPRPRYWYASFDSPALYRAVHVLATRSQIDSAAVLLALYALAHHRVTGIDPVMTMVLVSNRYRRGLAGTISPVTQAVPCLVEAGGTDLGQLLAQARGRVTAAYKHGYYDPLAFNELVADLSRERGEQIDTACYFNDRRSKHRTRGGPPPTAAEVTAALPRTTFEWKLKQDDDAYEHFFLHIENEPDTIRLSAVMDTHHVSPGDAEACLWGMERAAVEAACR